ncbi:ATP synthase subunit 4, mitochondrial [Monosporozyma unispora]|nr:atp4 subunit B of the stator stalk of mitochondrial F1F0 ATP synthase [Kazachstania unispora]
MSLRVATMKMSQRALLRSSMTRSSLYTGYRHLSTSQVMRKQSNGPTLDPKAKANSIIEALPGNTVLTKTGILGTSAAALVYAISNELYVVNEESILLVSFLAVGALLAKYVAPAYNNFAEARVKKVSDVLNASRQKHVDAVKDRITSVSALQNVSETTKVLFDVSKETVELEAKAFELKQQAELAHQAKSVLDSWVRYEDSLRRLEQKQIVESIIKNVHKELKDPKFQDKILQQSIADAEKILANLK